jgi:hypothetical protein
MEGKNLVFSLDFFQDEEGFPVAISYNPEYNILLLEHELSLDKVIAQVLVGFLVTYCKDQSIDLNSLLQESVVRRQVYDLLGDNG